MPFALGESHQAANWTLPAHGIALPNCLHTDQVSRAVRVTEVIVLHGKTVRAFTQYTAWRFLFAWIKSLRHQYEGLDSLVASLIGPEHMKRLGGPERWVDGSKKRLLLVAILSARQVSDRVSKFRRNRIIDQLCRNLAHCRMVKCQARPQMLSPSHSPYPCAEIGFRLEGRRDNCQFLDRRRREIG
jgi:hypothetical protein